MNTERIASEHLADALARAERRAGWNFRDEPMCAVIVGRCTIYVVPAKAWVDHRDGRAAQERRKRA